jgi:hypothetical protein
MELVQRQEHRLSPLARHTRALPSQCTPCQLRKPHLLPDTPTASLPCTSPLHTLNHPIAAPQSIPHSLTHTCRPPLPSGVMSLRYQPYGDAEPQVFLDIKANPRAAGDVAVRTCAFDTATGLGVFSIMPLAKHTSNKLAQVCRHAGCVVPVCCCCLLQLLRCCFAVLLHPCMKCTHRSSDGTPTQRSAAPYHALIPLTATTTLPHRWGCATAPLPSPLAPSCSHAAAASQSCGQWAACRASRWGCSSSLTAHCRSSGSTCWAGASAVVAWRSRLRMPTSRRCRLWRRLPARRCRAQKPGGAAAGESVWANVGKL